MMKIEADVTKAEAIVSSISLDNGGAKAVKAEIRKILNQAKKAAQSAAASAMASDPRKAKKAVKVRMYKTKLGGNVSILDKKTVTQMAIEGSKSTGGVSGIRRRRNVSARTRQVNGYRGADRAFILRFVNQGTAARLTGVRTKMRPANRGSLIGKKFFTPATQTVISAGVSTLASTLDRWQQQQVSKIK